MKATALLLASGLLILAFQNCGKGFNSIDLQSLESYSSSVPSPSPGPKPAQNTINCNPTVQPTKLSETCLRLAFVEKDNFKEYEPQYPLFSEGASKKRWIYIPAGKQIDTSNPDEWVFPTGTIIWKEFSVGNAKIETRQLRKIIDGFGLASWDFKVYLWRTDQSDADLYDLTALNYNSVPAQYAISQISSTYSLIPKESCVACHRGSKDVVLGFNYLQLSDSTKNSWLSTAGNQLMTKLWTSPDVIPGSALDKDTIGYIQSNCATCHSPLGTAAASLNFLHLSTSTSLADENIMKSALQRSSLIVNGNPDASTLYLRVLNGSMPSRSLIPYKISDSSAPTKIRSWILSL